MVRKIMLVEVEGKKFQPRNNKNSAILLDRTIWRKHKTSRTITEFWIRYVMTKFQLLLEHRQKAFAVLTRITVALNSREARGRKLLFQHCLLEGWQTEISPALTANRTPVSQGTLVLLSEESQLTSINQTIGKRTWTLLDDSEGLSQSWGY